MSTAGPATDVQFRDAAERIRSESETLVRLTRTWPTVDPALYGDTAARSTSEDRLFQAQGRVRAVTSALGEAAADCDRYAYGCREYYEAYRRYRAELAAYDATWAAYEHARARWSSGTGEGTAIVLGPPVPTAVIVFGPSVPGSPQTSTTTAALAATRAPEPVPPSLLRPLEPPCPSYCDPSPVR